MVTPWIEFTQLFWTYQISVKQPHQHIFSRVWQTIHCFQLVDYANEGYYVTFKIDGVTIFNAESNSIMKGCRYLDTLLWHINLRPKNQQTQIDEANNVH